MPFRGTSSLKDAQDKNPALRSFLACVGGPMRVPLWGTDLLTAEKDSLHSVRVCLPLRYLLHKVPHSDSTFFQLELEYASLALFTAPTGLKYG